MRAIHVPRTATTNSVGWSGDCARTLGCENGASGAEHAEARGRAAMRAAPPPATLSWMLTRLDVAQLVNIDVMQGGSTAAMHRLLARRHHQLIAGRTRAICRLHALLATMVAGGLSPKLTAKRATAELGKIRPTDAVGRERKHIAVEFLDEVRRHDRALGELERRVTVAVATANSNVTTVYGVRPIVACYLLGYSGDIRRFATAGHYARYNATAPIEASSGPKVRHRLNPNGNRQLNRAIHIAALGQISHDTAGRDYYQRKIADGKTPKEAFRALKRRISDAVYPQLRADLTR
jgi:transposase